MTDVEEPTPEERRAWWHALVDELHDKGQTIVSLLADGRGGSRVRFSPVWDEEEVEE